MKFSAIITFALISLTAAQSIQEQNANDAEKLTEDFKKLTPDSPCKDGDEACVQDQFAQCVGGKFALNSCGGGELKCVVLPLVNKRGTSITCSTEQDRLDRLAAARGKSPKEQPKGEENNIETPAESEPEPENGKNKDKDQPPESGKDDDNQPKQPQQSPKSPESGKGNENDPKIFRPQNADDAEKLTEDFKKLTPDSPCKDGEQACVQDQFAQCVGGKFALNSCGGGELKCVVLPLVNKPGTSITCSTEQDRLNRLDEARGETPSEPEPEPKSGKGKDDNEQPSENDKGKNNNVNQPDPESPDDDEQPSDDNKDDNEQPEDGKGKEENNSNPKQPQPPKSPENGKGEDSTAVIRKKNAEEAEKLQKEFESFTPDQPCNNNEVACIDDKLAQCANGKFALTECGPGLQCFVLPLVLKEGTTVTCTTEADRDARLNEAKNNLK